MPRKINGLSTILPLYDGFIIDLWGVMHGGQQAFPAALDALASLRAAGKRVVLLSNAPRRSALVASSLAPKGISPASYDAVLTSGEVTYQALKQRPDHMLQTLGERCYFLGKQYHFESYTDLALQFVELADAQFMLVTGSYTHDEGLPRFMPLLREAAERQLPMICANPDKIVVHHGEELMCPGTFAAAYEELGGQVRYFGKPDPQIYQQALDLLGCDSKRVLMIGDSFNTDIAGANASGLDSLWVVQTGIYAKQATDETSTSQLASSQPLSHQPTYWIERLAS